MHHICCARGITLSQGEIINPVILGKTIPDSCAGQHKNQYAALNKVLMFVCLMVNGMSSTESNGSAGLRQPQQGGRPATVVTVLGIEVDSEDQVMRLPDKKLFAFLAALSE